VEVVREEGDVLDDHDVDERGEDSRTEDGDEVRDDKGHDALKKGMFEE
jgi:hypothetical protein